MPGLWPESIRSDVVTPYAILREMASDLELSTGGTLRGEVGRRAAGDDRIALSFDIVVPALDGSRHRILTIGHAKDRPYPALVDAEVLQAPAGSSTKASRFLPDVRTFDVPISGRLRDTIQSETRAELKEKAKLGQSAAGDRELRAMLSEILKTPRVISLAVSLVALANEVSPPPDDEVASPARSENEDDSLGEEDNSGLATDEE
jgi:hypothetical protein